MHAELLELGLDAAGDFLQFDGIVGVASGNFVEQFGGGQAVFGMLRDFGSNGPPLREKCRKRRRGLGGSRSRRGVGPRERDGELLPGSRSWGRRGGGPGPWGQYPAA